MVSESQQRSHSLGQQEQQIQRQRSRSNKSDRRVEPAGSNADPVFSGILDRKEKGCFALKRGFFAIDLKTKEKKTKQTNKKMLRVTRDWWLRTGGRQSRVRVRVQAWP